MGFLKCKLCRGEIEIVSQDQRHSKKVKCLDCDFSNQDKEPEVFIRKRLIEI